MNVELGSLPSAPLTKAPQQQAQRPSVQPSPQRVESSKRKPLKMSKYTNEFLLIYSGTLMSIPSFTHLLTMEREP